MTVETVDLDGVPIQSRRIGSARRDSVTQAGERRSARIESLRALSALAVVACHAWAFTNGATFGTYHSRLILGAGFLGVSVFFALTGFLIFLPFARRDYAGGRRVNLGGYLLNRALRILPLYYVVLVVVATVDGVAAGTFLRFLWFGENFKDVLVTKAIDGPMWSLVVELHFYLLLPPLAWCLARFCKRSALRAVLCLAVLGAVSVAVYERSLSSSATWTYSLPANFVYFVPGMMLAIARARIDLARPKWLDHPLSRPEVFVLGAIIIWLAIFLDVDVEFRLLPVAALGTLLAVGSCTLQLRRGILDRMLDARPLAFIGVASYSLYLWHWPLLNWLPRPTPSGYGSWLVLLAYALPLCLAAAFISYRIVEYPVLRVRRRWFAQSTAPLE